MLRMKFIRLSFMVFLAQSLFCASAWAGWVPLNSSEGNFSVLMPTKAVLTQDVHKSFVGSIHENTYTSEGPTAIFSVEYSDLPGIAVSLGGEKTIFNKAKEGLLKELGGKEISYQEITLGSNKGMELIFEIPSNNYNGKARFYLVEKRLYVLVAQGKSKPNPNYGRFFSSFKLN